MTTRRRTSLAAALLLLGALAGCSDNSAEPARDASVPNGDTDPVAFSLPETLDLGGSTSSVRVADLDDDGYRDLAELVAKPGGKLVAVVAWGAASQPFAERWSKELPGSLSPTPGGTYDTRDSSSEALVVGDLDGDGRADLITAQGWLANEGARSFSWNALPDAESETLQPVALVTRSPSGFGGTAPVLVRGRLDGVVEQCEPSGACQDLAGQQPPCDTTMINCAIEDLAVADFDQDGKLDVLAGGPPQQAPFLDGSYLWLGGQQWQNPTWIEGLDPVDCEVGDIDGDGRADVVAQQREYISDFPSVTHVWLSEPGSPTLLKKVQSIYNADNHTDNAELADVEGDGCLDLLMIGVDAAGVHIRLGNKHGDRCSGLLGDHDPDEAQDVGWNSVPAVNAIGIQQLDVNGDQAPEWVLRRSPDHRLRFFAIPESLRAE